MLQTHTQAPTFQVACNLCYAVVVEQQDLQPGQAGEALQPHDGVV